MVESQTGRENISKKMVRMEGDSLREKEVPADAYYGIQTVRAIENFPVSSLRPYWAFMWVIAAIKRAAAEINLGLGLLDKSRSQ